MRKRIFTASIIAVCGFALSTNAQSAQGRAQIGDTRANVNAQTDEDKNDWQDQRSYNTQSSQSTQTRQTAQSGKVQSTNKASKLIGMEVVNQNQETLGEIKDVVIDFNSGRVSYAVLGVGGFLGIGDKMIAVPPTAFSMSQDNEKLTLRADRERLRQAPGFTDENWPDAQNPSWGASTFWREDSQWNQQQSNQRQYDYDPSRSSPNYDQSSQFDRYNQSQDRSQTSNRDFSYDYDRGDSRAYDSQSRQNDYRTSNQQRYNQDQGQQYDWQSNQQRYNTSTPNRQYQYDRTTDSFQDEDRVYRDDTSNRGYNQNRSPYQSRDMFNNQQQYRTQSGVQSGYDNNYDYDRNQSFQTGRNQSYNYNRQARDPRMDEWNPGQRDVLDRYRYTTDDRFNTDVDADVDYRRRNLDADWQTNFDYEPGRSDTRYNNRNTSQRYRSTTAYDSDRDYDNARTALERHNVESDTDYRSTTPNRQVGTARYSDDRSYQSTQRNQQRYDAVDRERGEDKIARSELNTVRGEIVAIDPEKKTMTVRTNDGERKEFGFTEIPTITIPGNNNALLVDLKPGYSVRVGYHDDDQGKSCAHVITRTAATDIR